MQKFILRDKKKAVLFCSIFVFLCAAVIFMYNNFFLYKNPVVKITDVKVTDTTVSKDMFGNNETCTKQSITAVFRNTLRKGQTITFEKSYYESQAATDKFSKGDCLFVKVNSSDAVTVISFKRDYLITALLGILIFVLLLIGKKRGLLTLSSLIINIIITLITVKLYSHGASLFALSIVCVLIFVFSTIILINGRNMKSWISIVSTLISVFISCGIVIAVMLITKAEGVHLEQLNLVIKDVKIVFYLQIIIGNLGGIMDICVSLSSAVYEIFVSDPSVTVADAKKSAKIIGSDIMGTMSTTILFAYLAGSLPMIVLLLKNNFSFSYIYHNCINLEIIRALAGCIGMVIAIPVTTYISLRVLGKRGKAQ